MGKAGLFVIPMLVAFSTFGAANGSTYTSSRSVFGAAKDHLLPDFLSGLHTRYRTPVPAILFLVGTFWPKYVLGWMDPNSTTGQKFHKKIQPGGPLFSWNIGPLDQVCQD